MCHPTSYQRLPRIDYWTASLLSNSSLYERARERGEREPGRKRVRFSPTAFFLHTISHTIILDTPLASLADHAQAGPVGRPASVNHFTKYEMHEKNEMDQQPCGAEYRRTKYEKHEMHEIDEPPPR